MLKCSHRQGGHHAPADVEHPKGDDHKHLLHLHLLLLMICSGVSWEDVFKYVGHMKDCECVLLLVYPLFNSFKKNL